MFTQDTNKLFKKKKAARASSLPHKPLEFEMQTILIFSHEEHWNIEHWKNNKAEQKQKFFKGRKGRVSHLTIGSRS